jgi:hypothetical protein
MELLDRLFQRATPLPPRMPKPFDIDAEVVWEHRVGGDVRFHSAIVRDYDYREDIGEDGQMIPVYLAVIAVAGRGGVRRESVPYGEITLASQWTLPQFRRFWR